jgi:hypothetical protein
MTWNKSFDWKKNFCTWPKWTAAKWLRSEYLNHVTFFATWIIIIFSGEIFLSQDIKLWTALRVLLLGIKKEIAIVELPWERYQLCVNILGCIAIAVQFYSIFVLDSTPTSRIWFPRTLLIIRSSYYSFTGRFNFAFYTEDIYPLTFLRFREEIFTIVTRS